MYNLPENFDHDRDIVYEPHERMMELADEPGEGVFGMSMLEAWIERELNKYDKRNKDKSN